MTHARTVAIVQRSLIEVFADVDGWFERPVDERTFQPASRGWTIDQVLEHISLTNHFLMVTLRKAVEKAVRRAALGQLPLEAARTHGTDRSSRHSRGPRKPAAAA